MPTNVKHQVNDTLETRYFSDGRFILVCIGIWMVNTVVNNVNELLNKKVKKDLSVNSYKGIKVVIIRS